MRVWLLSTLCIPLAMGCSDAVVMNTPYDLTESTHAPDLTGALPHDLATDGAPADQATALDGALATDLTPPLTDLIGASPPYRPFGSHAQLYPATVIFPSESAMARDNAVKAAYNAWKTDYLAVGCATDRYVVQYGNDPGGLTVSEAHGYGMIIAALMAGFDPDAQDIFDGLYRYYDAHRSGYDLTDYGHATNYFMSWRQNNQCQNVQGNCDATDGDVDIAYALLLADRQWGSGGGIDYRGRALLLIDQLMDTLIVSAATTSPTYILIGDCVVDDAAWKKRTRTSDFILAEYRAFRAASGDARWDDAIDGMLDIAASLQSNHSTSGLLPDFVEDANTDPAPAAPNTLESDHDGHWYANACRTPWRIGQDAVFFDTSASKSVAAAMTTFMRDETNDDPKQICSGYTLDGSPLDACDWHSLEYIAPFAVAAMLDASNQAWLDALWAIMKNPALVDSPRQYYGDTINVMTMLVVSGNWWSP